MQPCHKHKGESHQPEIAEVGREEAGSLKILHEPWAGSLQKNNYLPVPRVVQEKRMRKPWGISGRLIALFPKNIVK